MLRASDLGSTAKVVESSYTKPKNSLDPEARSVYDLTMSPARSYVVASQEVLVGETKPETQYFGAIATSGVAAGFGKVGKATPVSLSGIGDSARGEFVHVTIGGQAAYEAVVVLLRGTYLDLVVGASTSTFAAGDVHSLAQLAAKRLDNGFAG